MVLGDRHRYRNPYPTLMSDDDCVPSPIVEGTELRQPPNIVIHWPSRFRSQASFHADSGAESEDVETSIRDTSYHSFCGQHCCHQGWARIPSRGSRITRAPRAKRRRSDAGPGLI
jgi:hypothetical protein